MCEKYSFLTQNRLKNFLYNNINGFREKVVRKFGRIILIDEEAFLEYVANGTSSKQNYITKYNETNPEETPKPDNQ